MSADISLAPSRHADREIILRVDAVSSGYGKSDILHDVSFDVRRGTLTILVGPNGSGKSSLLGLIGRLLAPTRGSVLLDGETIHNLPTRMVARQLAILPQSPTLPEALSVYDLVCRGRYPHRGLLSFWTKTDEIAVEAALKITGTLDYADSAVDTLSGGQRQRCWIAMALAQETPVLLLDEPTTYLDLHFQLDVLDLLHRLTRDHGRSIVAVLHDINQAVNYADQLIFLKDGRVKQVLDVPDTCEPDIIRSVFDVQTSRLVDPMSGAIAFIPQAMGKAQ